MRAPAAPRLLALPLLAALALGASARVPGENVTYAHAQVLRATPVYATQRVRVPEERCEAREDGERACRTVEVEREERRIVGYDVEYQYKGETFMSRLASDPGDRLRIRVSVQPAEMRR